MQIMDDFSELYKNYYPPCSDTGCSDCELDSKEHGFCLYLRVKEFFGLKFIDESNIVSAQEWLDSFAYIIDNYDSVYVRCNGVSCGNCDYKKFVDFITITGKNAPACSRALEKYMADNFKHWRKE